MLDKIINFSLKNKLIIILATLTIVGFGIYAIFNIPVGAVPDITNNQVQVITTSNNLSTQEIEQFITAPVELEMANLPGVEEIRSVSKFGLSVVTIVFKESMGTYLPRTLIAEKIKSASEKFLKDLGLLKWVRLLRDWAKSTNTHWMSNPVMRIVTVLWICGQFTIGLCGVNFPELMAWWK